MSSRICGPNGKMAKCREITENEARLDRPLEELLELLFAGSFPFFSFRIRVYRESTKNWANRINSPTRTSVIYSRVVNMAMWDNFSFQRHCPIMTQVARRGLLLRGHQRSLDSLWFHKARVGPNHIFVSGLSKGRFSLSPPLKFIHKRITMSSDLSF
jgi:hypothetical protein